jgi:hypothetical protein
MMRRYFWLLFGGIWFAAGLGLSFDTGRRLIAGERSGDVFILIPVAVFFTLAGATILFVDIRKRMIHAALLDSGLLVNGTITAVEETNLRINGVIQWRVRYRYTDHFGQTQNGKSSYLPPHEAEAWNEGDSVQIRYDPQRTSRSMVLVAS